ncbi:MAG: deoxyhypusine synthase [archaeon]
MHKDILKKQVKDFQLHKIKNFEELAEALFESGGFGAKHFGLGVKIFKEMFKDKNCIRFLSFPACIVSTGLRGVLAEAISKKLFDVIVTTCGTLDHDLARAFGGKYYHGYFNFDDAKLKDLDIYRLGNIFIPHEYYGGVLEKNLQQIFKKIVTEKKEWAPWELIQRIGFEIKDKNSIVAQAAKARVPIIIPGIMDGAFGSNLLFFNELKIDVLEDQKKIAEYAFTKKKTGALMLGGGISKHHTIWWNQFKGGLDYAVYITTATQYDGSLSGARLEEAVSWGKIKKNAKYVTIDGDVTIILPFLLKSVYETK